MLFDAVTGTCVVTLFSTRLISLSSELFSFGTISYTSYTQSMVRGGAKRISRKKN